MPITVLLTGFGPFPGAPFNPTTALPGQLAARRRPALADVTRIAHAFRTSYAAVERELPALLERVRPDVVLLFGVAPRTKYLRIETRARNARSLLFCDADGRRPGTSAIAPKEPTTRSGQAPHRILLAAVRAKRFPARLSPSAGRYLCNFIYWRALEATRGGRTPLVQFIHVPMVRRAPTRPASERRLTPADLLRAGEAVLLAMITTARERQRQEVVPAAVSIELQPAQKREPQQVVAGRRGQRVAQR